MGSGSAAAAQASVQTRSAEQGLTVLALDAALRGCSVALLAAGEIRAAADWAGPHGQAERLVPLVGEVLAQARMAPAALDLIAVTLGPGSFTGLRVGLAAAKGLALGTGRPLRGIGTLEALAYLVPAEIPGARGEDRPLLVTIDARRGEFYAQAFAPAARSGPGLERRPLAPPALVPAAALAGLAPGPLALAGPGSIAAAAALAGRDLCFAGAIDRPEAVALARLAALRGRPERGAPQPSPLYLRAPDARLPAG